MGKLPNPNPTNPNHTPTNPNPNPNPNPSPTSTSPPRYEHVPTSSASLHTQLLQLPTELTTNTDHVTVHSTLHDSSESQFQQHPSQSPFNTNNDNPQQEQIMNLPMEQLELIISFSSHIAAINYLQSQLLQHRHWIQHQLHYLRILETNQPKLQVFPIILQLDLDYYTTVNDDDYTPEFHVVDIYHMLYHIPHIGIFTPTEDNHIQLQHLSSHIDTNIFPKSTLITYVTNSPIVCLISNANISIFSIKDSYIQQMVFNSNTQPQSSTTNTSNKKRKRTYKTSEADRATNYKWYHRNKTWLAKKYKTTHNKPGAIQLLNQHPEADIQTLIQTYTPQPQLPPISVSTTTKTWSDIFTQPTQHKTSLCPPTETKSISNKRKHDETTTTPSITQFIIRNTKPNNQSEDSVTITQTTKEFKTSANRRHSKSIWYHQHKDIISVQNKDKRAKRKLEELSTPTPPGIQAFFSKKPKTNDDTKPP